LLIILAIYDVQTNFSDLPLLRHCESDIQFRLSVVIIGQCVLTEILLYILF